MLLGIDTGGTFTDFVLFHEGRMRIHKVLSTPHAPEEAILQGIRELGVPLEGLRIVHGSTVATNAVLEGKGVRTALVTNRGFGDLMTIGRQNRPRLYDLQPPPRPVAVPPEAVVEAATRTHADGHTDPPLDTGELEAIRRRIEAIDPEAVAICLLFSFLDEGEERRIAEALGGARFVCRSSEVLPEYREYERAVATWLNASVGPLVSGYLGRLEGAVAPAALQVMTSDGGTLPARRAGRHGVRLLLSGPAGGLRGALFLAESAGEQRLMTFDMGGTSTDVALLEGSISLTTEGHVAHWPVAVPQVEMHTIGAGGGSIAWIDAGGALQVGPRSAGADPGPACYGRGGAEPTVTDANLVLGRLPADAALGGSLRLDRDAALAAVGRLGARLGLPPEQTAAGIVRVADEHMAQALRVISVQRGHDPRAYVLVSFGGAGGLHVCSLAERLRMSRAMVPLHAGVLSALGMLVAPPQRQASRTVVRRLDGLDEGEAEALVATLRGEAQRALSGDGIPPSAQHFEVHGELRYLGQSSTLTLPWQGVAASAEAFHAAHRRRFGHRLDHPVELVTLRVTARGESTPLSLQGERGEAGSPRPGSAKVWGLDRVPVYSRSELPEGMEIAGPAIVTDPVATTWVEARWRCRRDAAGNLLLWREEERPLAGC